MARRSGRQATRKLSITEVTPAADFMLLSSPFGMADRDCDGAFIVPAGASRH
jgi:hypothetical protein